MDNWTHRQHYIHNMNPEKSTLTNSNIISDYATDKIITPGSANKFMMLGFHTIVATICV